MAPTTDAAEAEGPGAGGRWGGGGVGVTRRAAVNAARAVPRRSPPGVGGSGGRRAARSATAWRSPANPVKQHEVSQQRGSQGATG
ncbi:hypothetical protein QF035_010693 [Streptomyces umbrinus]|uniref:Uncharacterized protein n=1 Tax=Streptomyces umbrinus TaxID=67370 RepID=A0ABU0TBC5_9ACTN|nr:hypothetical protein [Streptomyces umbrinus]